jgi:hypothetical protein
VKTWAKTWMHDMFIALQRCISFLSFSLVPFVLFLFLYGGRISALAWDAAKPAAKTAARAAGATGA